MRHNLGTSVVGFYLVHLGKSTRVIQGIQDWTISDPLEKSIQIHCIYILKKEHYILYICILYIASRLTGMEVVDNHLVVKENGLPGAGFPLPC